MKHGRLAQMRSETLTSAKIGRAQGRARGLRQRASGYKSPPLGGPSKDELSIQIIFVINVIKLGGNKKKMDLLLTFSNNIHLIEITQFLCNLKFVRIHAFLLRKRIHRKP